MTSQVSPSSRRARTTKASPCRAPTSLELRNRAETGRSVDGQGPHPFVLREVDLVSLGGEGDDLDPAGGNRPDVVALADGLSSVGRLDLRLDRIGQRA